MPRLSITTLALAIYVASPCLAQEAISDSTLIDHRVIELVEDFEANVATEEQILQLLALVLQDEERLERTGAHPDSLRSRLLQNTVVIEATDDAELHRHSPPVLHDSAEAERLFQQALDNAPTDKARADYLYAREAKGYGGGGCAQALEIFPSHSPCRYQNLNALGRRVGTQRSLTGRFNYWCLADRYRQLAASTNDSRIARAARRATHQYERAAPTREQFESEGYTVGQMVECSVMGGRTPVRAR